MSSFRISLRAARVNAGLTQEDAAHLIGKTKQTIVNWESGATKIRAADLVELARIYGIPLEFLAIPGQEDDGTPVIPGKSGGLLM